MSKPPSPTTLRPSPGRASGINRKAIVIGGISILVIGGFAISQMYLVDESRLVKKEGGVHVPVDDGEFLKDAPKDYSFMRKDEPAAAPAAPLPGMTPAVLAAPPPPPDPPLAKCRRPTLSYSTGGMETSYEESLEYDQCLAERAYAVRLREYAKRYPTQGNGQPFTGGGQLVAAGGDGQSYQPGLGYSGGAGSSAGSGRAAVSSSSGATQSTTAVADASAEPASALYHPGGLEELPLDECVIAAGSDIFASLDKDVNVSQSGSARIRVSHDVRDFTGERIAIPHGSTITVGYSGDLQYGQERAQIGSTILTLPNGLTMSLDGLQGYDASGQVGLPVDVNNHNLALFGTAILGGLIDAIPAAAGLRANVEFGGSVGEVTSTGRMIVERELERPPTAEPIPAGTEILISLDKHVVLGECYE